MSEKRFTEDESYLVNYEEYKCIFDRVQGKHLYLSEVIALLNSLVDGNRELRQSHNKSECFYCKYCFRDDNYGVCCENRNSEYFTPHWDLHWENIIDCEYFERIGCDDV